MTIILLIVCFIALFYLLRSAYKDSQKVQKRQTTLLPNTKEEASIQKIASSQSQEEAFQKLLVHHIERIANTDTTHAAFVKQYFSGDIIDQLCEMAQKKMALSLSDGDDHNILFGSGSVCYDVTTFPMPMQGVCSHLNQKYGGYIKLVNNIMNRHPIFTVQGCRILCFIAFGRAGKDAWVNVGILALDSEWQGASALPVEFLNADERQQLRAIF